MNAIRITAGLDPTDVAGPGYWLLPNGKSMYEQSKLIETQLAAGGGDVQAATSRGATPPVSAWLFASRRPSGSVAS